MSERLWSFLGPLKRLKNIIRAWPFDPPNPREPFTEVVEGMSKEKEQSPGESE